jgi:hypothetical protein
LERIPGPTPFPIDPDQNDITDHNLLKPRIASMPKVKSTLFNLPFLFPCLILIATGAVLTTSVQTTNADEPIVFISAFATGDEGAIHAFQLDQKSGALKPVHRTTGVEHPFFLALSRNRRFLYSIHAKQFGGKESEEVAAYEEKVTGEHQRPRAAGKLEYLSSQDLRKRREKATRR